MAGMERRVAKKSSTERDTGDPGCLGRWLAAGAVYGASVAQGFARAPHGKRFARQTWTSAHDPLDALLLGSMGVGMLVLPALNAASPSLRRFDHPLPRAARGPVAALGVAALAGGWWLFVRSHADLDDNWSPLVGTREGQRLVTTGVYARIRHPMYASQFLTGLGQALLLQNWVAGPANLACFLPLYLHRVGREDALMRATFGAESDAWAARTGRVLPRQGQRAASDSTAREANTAKPKAMPV